MKKKCFLGIAIALGFTLSANYLCDGMISTALAGVCADVQAKEVTKKDKAEDTTKKDVTENNSKKKKTTKKKNVKKKKIAIDAGHQLRGNYGLEAVAPGSRTRKYKVAGGASGVSTHLPEYKLNLAVAKKLKKILIKRGYSVYMVRTKNDVNISNQQRAKRVNKSKADAYIRIHGDSIGSSSVQGATVLCCSSSNRYTKKVYAKSKRLSSDVISAYCKKTKIRNRGISYRDDLTGTNWSKVPTTLIEMGFLSNPTEDRKMASSAFQTKMAKGIADGIDRYFHKK